MSEKDTAVSIHVSIADKKFPIIAKNQDEEEVYRAASKRINDMISKFRAKYGSQADPLDFLYLTAFQHTVALIRAERRNDTEPILDEIEKLNRRIDEITKE
ncbi:cell division protein ZapA [Odoribacter lunatus]|uniref:cell division protein ZapA n=1 Tax=Odoribacter lunatus TaxID=2941335 RepID=UPI00203DD3D5|nr:cell division protein ZapA [Odoribacter lunatus]